MPAVKKAVVKPRPKPAKVGGKSGSVNVGTSPNYAAPVAKLRALEKHVNMSVVGRSVLVRGIMVSLIARQNVLALGVPGTAKTMAVHKIAEAFSGNGAFDILLTKFTKANEVFGPTDVEALENGVLRTNTAGYLPTASVGVIDEIFKGSSAILNALLRIANERTFRNGAVIEKTSVRMLVGMSNEFPEDPALLAAFFDRFPSKFMIGYLEQDDFTDMLQIVDSDASNVPCPVSLDDADFAELDKLVKSVSVGTQIIETIAQIRNDLNMANVRISDRRWVQAMRLMAANAVYHGRTQVTRKDFDVLKAVCWNTETDKAEIEKIVVNYMNPLDREIKNILDETNAARQAVLDASNYDGKDGGRPSPDLVRAAAAGAQAYSGCKSHDFRIDSIRDLAETDEDRRMIADAENAIDQVKRTVMAVANGRNELAKLAEIDLGMSDSGTYAEPEWEE